MKIVCFCQKFYNRTRTRDTDRNRAGGPERLEMEAKQMKNGKLQVAVVGCGGIANQKHFPALSGQKDKCEIIAFCDIDEERAKTAAAKYGAPGCQVTTDYMDVMENPDVDVVHVCTPNVAHCPITVAAFEAGKHVMCEKPMAATTADAQKMMDAWKKSGKKFTVGDQNRFRTDSQALKRACDEGKLGDIYFAKAHAVRRCAVPTWGVFPDKSKQGGGPLIDIGYDGCTCIEVEDKAFEGSQEKVLDSLRLSKRYMEQFVI